MLDFRDHFKYMYVLQLIIIAKTSTPNRNELAIELLIKAKYHATYLRVFIDSHLESIDKFLNEAAS